MAAAFPLTIVVSDSAALNRIGSEAYVQLDIIPAKDKC